jgi:hypothetical protein
VILPLVLAQLPALYWPQGVESAPALKQAGIERLCVAPDQVEAWRKAGFAAVAMSAVDLASREKLHAPGIVARAELASATRSPWIFTNGWRFQRRREGKYSYDLPVGTAALAAAEARAYGGDAVLRVDPADLGALGRMLTFLAELPEDDLPDIADFGVVDDGSPLIGEVMSLLSRRNLLFRMVKAPSPQFRINIALGTKEYPKAEAADPSAFALKVRRQLGDEQRALRVFGSEVVVCRLVGDATRVRLHLLNYGGREIGSLRIRLRGAYAEGEARVAGLGRVPLEEHVVSEGGTEFSIPRMNAYALIELAASQP